MRKVLYVSPSGSQWKIHWQHETNGSLFDRKEDAIKKAKQMVAALPEAEVSSIRVQRADGKFQTEWTYGNDPYPPKG
jgi:hypothetical protein